MNVIWYGVLLIVAGVIFYSAPEGVRSWYTRSAKSRRVTPLKRPEWRAREQRLGAVMVGSGIAIVVLRLLLSGLIVDVIATLVLLVLIIWRVLSFIGD